MRSRYAIGESFTVEGVEITVEPFYYRGGASTAGKAAVLDSRGRLQAAHTNLRFDFGGLVDRVEVSYLNHGGGTNLEVNGERRLAPRLRDLAGEEIGGAEVSFTSLETYPRGVREGDGGILTVEGEITSFSVGGQEFPIYSVCRYGSPRIPVVFIHGHTRGSEEAWKAPGSDGVSFSRVLAANPQLPIDPFYLDLPLHGPGNGDNRERSIEDDAVDLRVFIEGGIDSHGEEQVGILNRPEYEGVEWVAIIAFSQGTLSSRYYIKHHMGEEREGDLTVSELVTLAAPNHGIWNQWACGGRYQLDRVRRELCGGRTAVVPEDADAPCAPCAPCGSCQPPAFWISDGASFLEQLNGHSFGESCEAGFAWPKEAPFSRSLGESADQGVLYVNLFAAEREDEIVGGAWPPVDCLGRGLAWNHAPDAENVAVPSSDRATHYEFTQEWATVCLALRTVVEHQPPVRELTNVALADIEAVACEGLTRPSS
ncbi:MAG: hypothetical protein SX243_20075 [Acidobacteriota bacterium]|nr:hypothetical protein [Acidobacteriota bacterium]